MSKVIIDICLYVFATILLWYYANSVFDSKSKKSLCLCFSFAIHIVLYIVYQFNVVYLNIALLIILYALFFKAMYLNNIRTAVFHSTIYVIILFASEILVMSTSGLIFKDFNSLDNSTSAYLYVVALSKLLLFIAVMFLVRVFSYKKPESIQDRSFWLLFSMPFASIMMILAFRYVAYEVILTPMMNTAWIVSTLLVLFSNIIVFIIYGNSQRNLTELFELKTAKLQEEQDKKYFDLIESTNTEMRGFVHDIKNHLIQISNIDSIADIQDYINDLLLGVDKFTYSGISKNKMLDLIISKYIRICENKGIRFEVDAKTANLSYINDADLSTLLNNLLDNAVESAEKSYEGFIYLSVFSRNELFDGLIIRNTCLQKPYDINGKLQTTKNNKKIHGIGISNINKIIKKYNAVYDWRYDAENNVFETDIAFKRQ